MRINVYSQELTDEIEAVMKLGKNENGDDAMFRGVRLYLLSPDQLHHTQDDDDRSAITLWLPKSVDRRRALAKTLCNLSDMVLQAEQS